MGAAMLAQGLGKSRYLGNWPAFIGPNKRGLNDEHPLPDPL